MSRHSKSMNLTRLNDLVLGSFALVPSSETLDHLVRYLSTWSGSECVNFSPNFIFILELMTCDYPSPQQAFHGQSIQYIHETNVIFTWKQRLYNMPSNSLYLYCMPVLVFNTAQDSRKIQWVALRRAGAKLAVLWATLGFCGESGVSLVDALLSDNWATHTYISQWLGILPIFQWLISLERSPPPTRNLLTIERLQGWSMLAYYPLEHIYYLCTNGIIPSSFPSLLSLFTSTSPRKRIRLNTDAIGIWSCRFWALYVVLQFAHLREDRKLLRLKERSLGKTKGKISDAMAEEAELDLRKRWDSYWNEVVVNVGYLPLTAHW